MQSPVVWPNFPGLGGLSGGRDLKYRDNSSSSCRSRNGFVQTVYMYVCTLYSVCREVSLLYKI